MKSEQCWRRRRWSCTIFWNSRSASSMAGRLVSTHALTLVRRWRSTSAAAPVPAYGKLEGVVVGSLLVRQEEERLAHHREHRPEALPLRLLVPGGQRGNGQYGASVLPRGERRL